jgi:hypothetical protein
MSKAPKPTPPPPPPPPSPKPDDGLRGQRDLNERIEKGYVPPPPPPDKENN